MSMPLSPRSPAFFNRGLPPTPTMEKLFSMTPSTKRNSASLASEALSSPFQTDVDDDGKLPYNATSSPVRQQTTPKRTESSAKSVESFEIHEDKENMPEEATSSVKGTHNLTATEPAKILEDVTLSHIQTYEQSARSQLSTGKRVASADVILDMNSTRFPEDDDMQSIVSDDTCFSTFSAVPNADMTLFAKLGNRTADNTIRSPVRQTPSSKISHTPSTAYNKNHIHSRSPSPTPRGTRRERRDGDTTNLLLDFTQTLDVGAKSTRQSPTKHHKTAREPQLLSYIHNQRMPSPSKNIPATPSGRRNLMTLLDFDLPPQPTPRSIPTITVRELESLKSQYLSEISSLKASLSGREAEVDSLKKAVVDAERRVGEAQEVVREERNAREHAERERGEWEKKGHAVEAVLQTVRDEFEYAEKEKEDLLAKLDESHRQCDETELKLAEATTKASVAKGETNQATSEVNKDVNIPEHVIAQRVNAQLDEKMENLARELHAVYKKKHETKVSTLKKTYEARSEKRCHELQLKVEELERQNDDLQAAKDTTFSDQFPGALPTAEHSADLRRLAAQTAELEEHKAKLAGLTEEMRTTCENHDRLRSDLEKERIEKGELVAAVDEMLALQADVGQPNAIVEDFRKSISRPPSGLRGPGFSGMKNTGVTMGKSKMLVNIERMGSTRGQ